MRIKYLACAAFLGTSLAACAQQKEKPQQSSTKKVNKLNTEKITNATAEKAISALQDGNKAAWYALFTADAQMTDDGNKIDFKDFSASAMGHEYFTSIDKVENNGLDVYGKFHSDKWGNFKTYFKFHLNAEGKISLLEIGQANY